MKLEITKGEWEFINGGTNGFYVRVKGLFGSIARVFLENRLVNIKESKANAELIADAGTTANKCGLLPSELLVQRDELLMYLRGIVQCCDGNEPKHEQIYHIANDAINKTK